MDALFDFMQLVASNVWVYGVTFLFVLSVLVFVHEWGHFIVARMCGVRVDTFSIGFGQEIFGWTSKTGTRWKIALFPLGGYVKMFGDTDPASAGHSDKIEGESGEVRELTEAERGVAFFAKSVSQRAAIVFAGPAVNFLFAIIVLAFLYGFIGKPITPPQAMGIEVGGAAAEAGFQPHDVIKSIDGEPIRSFDEIRRVVMLALDTPLTFKVERGGQDLELIVTPKKMSEKDRFGFQHEKGYLGLIGPANGLDITKMSEINGVATNGDPDVARDLLKKNMDRDVTIQMETGAGEGKKVSALVIHPPKSMNDQLYDPASRDYNALILGTKPGDEIQKFGPLEAVGVSIKETGRIVVETLGAVWQMVTGTRSATELGGIIRIGALAGDMAERGMIALLTFTALLSINLGLINLFPIPMLDGGHLVFYAAEAIRGKPLSDRVQEYAFRFGLVVLVTLMVFANLNDILQLLL
jgi:regulator of sigma E protease